MSARDDYAPASGDGVCTEAVWGPMCDEIDLLRGDVSNLLTKLAMINAEVDLIWRAVGRPLGESKARAALDMLRLLTGTFP